MYFNCQTSKDRIKYLFTDNHGGYLTPYMATAQNY